MAWESVKKLIVNDNEVDFTFDDSFLPTLMPMNAQAIVYGNFATVGCSCSLPTFTGYGYSKLYPFDEYTLGDTDYKLGYGFNSNQSFTRYIYDPDTQNQYGYTGYYNYPDMAEMIVLPLIDEENQQGMFVMVEWRYPDTTNFIQFESFGDRNNPNYLTACYNAIKNAIPPAYNWVSVPSVSGKNGIISLAQIASGSINDGEPVSDAAATAFSDLPAECNVGEIIDELLPYEESLVDVLVKYKVKGAVTGAFDYVKLVAKKGSIPKSVEDGDKVVDINPSKKSKLVTGLDEGSKYYFVIFEKDSAGQTAKSNEMSIETGYLEHNGWELVNKIKFKDGSEFTFNVPDNLKNPVINYLNTNGLVAINIGIEVIPKGQDANINNYNITSFPLQANAAETNIDSVHYFNDNHTDILQLWYAHQLQQYSIVAGGYAIANANNMCSNDYGGYCLCPFINRSEHKAIFGYFTTAYRLEVDKDIYYVNWFANDAQSYEDKSELLYDALMEVIE